MHELGIVFSMIDTLEDVAAQNDVTSIARVTLRLGEVSGVLPDYLLDCWNWASNKHEVTKGAELELATVPAVTRCNACGADYGTVAHGRTCPACGSQNTVLLTGNEIEIESITVTDHA